MKRISDIEELRASLDDAKHYIQSAIDSAADMEDNEMDPTAAVIEALREGLRMIEYKYGTSSNESAEVRRFIDAADAL